MTDAPRIPPLSPTDFTPEQAELVGDWSHLAFSRVMARHPAFYRVFVPYIKQMIPGSILPPRDREVLVLRTLALSDEVYEAHHHLLIARNAGMSDAEIAAAAQGAADLSDWDRTLVRAADELVADRCLSDATWAALAGRYDEPQMMEVVGLVGCYTVMAMLTKSFGMELEGSGEEFDRIQALRKYV